MSYRQFNTRILVVDDDETVRDSFREILSPDKSKSGVSAELEMAEAKLFGDFDSSASSAPIKKSSATFEFEFDEASNGKQALEMIEKALSDDNPYAAVFVDMRMPGWDGLETVQHIRKVDKRAEIIFVTAYSDHTIEDIVTAVGTNVSYHCKPFSVEEIEQIATKAVYEWNKTINLENLIRTIARLRAQTWQMESLLSNILQQVAYLLGTHSAMIAMKQEDAYQKVLGIGNLCDDGAAESFLKALPMDVGEDGFQSDSFAYFKVEAYGVLAVFETGGKPLNNERIYIVRLFLEQAALAIRNVDLQDALIKKEKLSAVGQSTSMIAHDLRNSLGSIDLAIEMILDEFDDKDFVKDTLNSISEAANDGLAFVNDIMDFTSNAEIEKHPVELESIIESVEGKTKWMTDKFKVSLAIERNGNTEFPADGRKIYRALTNLIKNSAEALSENGTENPKITLTVGVQKDKLLFEVKDNGPGIPEKIMDTLFDPFVTQGKSSGTGLGLAIVQQIVEGHGGTITVDSSDQGASFKIELPL
jgi:signal transduction histidine kinase/DNA-binding response OmpR family regulator